MQRPKIGKPYIFVRDGAAGIEWFEYTRYDDDDSAGVSNMRVSYSYDNIPEAWKRALTDLEEFGFTLLAEAVLTGMVPADWEPTAANQARYLEPVGYDTQDQPTDPAS